MQLPPFPSFELLTELVAFADAAYATDSKMWHSISGYVIVYAGAAIAYEAKMPPTIATSSIEAKFIAHLRSVLHDLGLSQSRPTVIYEDNKASINMINDSKPMTCSRHINVQHFAIQDW